MKRFHYTAVELDCLMQESALTKEDCRKGVLTLIDGTNYRFEELAAERPRSRRPKVYEGRFVSLVRLGNGGYRIYLRAKDNAEELRSSQFAFWVYMELNEVFQYMERDQSASHGEESQPENRAAVSSAAQSENPVAGQSNVQSVKE